MRRLLCLFACVLPTACSSAPALPAGQGRGLIAFDPAPPAGAQVWQRPAVRAGETFTLLRGGQVKNRFVVTEATAAGHTLQDESGHRLRRDADFGNLGAWPAAGDEPDHALAPVDVRYHWPLWVGKKWRCEFADCKRGRPAMLIEVGYSVEGLDSVVVPAGTFQEKLVVEGEKYLDRISFVWFAPDAGIEVRQVIDGTAFELVERSPAR